VKQVDKVSWFAKNRIVFGVGLLLLLLVVVVVQRVKIERTNGLVEEESNLVLPVKLDFEGQPIEWVPIPLDYMAYSQDRSFVRLIAKVVQVRERGGEIQAKMLFVANDQRIVEDWVLVGDMAGDRSFYLEVQDGNELFPVSDKVEGRSVRGGQLLDALNEWLGRRGIIMLMVDRKSGTEGLAEMEDVYAKLECNRWLLNRLHGGELGEMKKCMPYITQIMFYAE